MSRTTSGVLADEARLPPPPVRRNGELALPYLAMTRVLLLGPTFGLPTGVLLVRDLLPTSCPLGQGRKHTACAPPPSRIREP